MAPTQTIDGENEINLTFTSKDVTIIIESLTRYADYYNKHGFTNMEIKTYILLDKIKKEVRNNA